MNEILRAIFYILIFPGLIFTAIMGLFFCWMDRKVTARIQSRRGPPWYQCYADIGKLMIKKMILPKGSKKAGFLLAPLIGLAGITLVSTIVFRVNIAKDSTFVGDLIVVLYLLILPSLALIIGGSSSRNPFSGVGASREMGIVLAYELPFILAIFTCIIKTKSILFGNILLYQSEHGLMIYNLSCLVTFIVALICLQAKLGYIPFDIPEAESEIIGGTLAEYSGIALGVFKLTRAMMLFTLPIFLITIFLGGINFSALGIISLLGKYLGILLLIIVVRATHARFRIDQAVKFFWGPVTGIAIAGMILAILGI